MRAHLPSYEMRAPANLNEVLSLLSNEQGEWRPFAGGTDIMVLFEAGKLSHKKFVSIWGLSELQGIEVNENEVRIGAITTYSQIRANTILQKEFPMLCQAASETGAIAIQSRGTLGGNIINASPAADSPPALLAYEARLELQSSKGIRIVDYDGFHLDYKKTQLHPNEILARIILPRSQNKKLDHYRKVGTRKAQAISKVCIAALVRLGAGKIKEARIAFGSIAPTPIRCKKVEALIVGKTINAKLISVAKAEVLKEISPIDDIRSTSLYRRTVAANLLEEFLEKCGTGLVN